MRLHLDAGHGGQSDRGAIANGITEADYNLRLTRELITRLNRNHPEVEVSASRTDDIGLGLAERGKLSYDFHTDLVISIHCNAHHSRSDFHGLLCFHWPGNVAGRKVGNAIARCAPHGLHKSGWSSIATTADASEDDDWLQRPRNVLQVHAATAVLVEVGYLTNEMDAELLRLQPTIDWLCYSILSGVAQYRLL